MGSNLFTHFDEKTEDQTDFILLLGFTKTLVILSVLAITGVQQASMALIVTPLVFLPLFVSSYFVTEGNILTSNVSMSGQAAAYTVGLLAALIPARGLGIGELSFFSLATTEGAYLSVLSELEPLTQDVVNFSLVTWAENVFLIPIGGLFYFLWGQLFSNVDRLNGLDTMPVKLLLSAVPIGIFFALLHGARTPAFLMIASAVMIVWVVAVGLDSRTRSQLVDFVPATILLTIGHHVGHNILAGDGTLFGYITDLLGFGVIEFVVMIMISIVTLDFSHVLTEDLAFQLVGVIELVWHFLVFGLSVVWFYRKLGRFR